jgi:hypothetical protein
LSWEGTHLFFSHSDSDKKSSASDNINMLEFLIDNIFALFDGRVLQQTVGILMDTNCAPPLDDLFLYSYKADFIQGKRKEDNPIDPLISRSAILMIAFH